MSASELIHAILSLLHLHYTAQSSNLLWEIILNIGKYNYEIVEPSLEKVD